MTKRREPGRRQMGRLPGVSLRIAAGLGGGYALAAVSAAAVAAALPVPRSEAVLAGSMSSFAVMLGAIIWAFAARSPWRAAAGILLPVLLAGAVLLAAAAGR